MSTNVAVSIPANEWQPSFASWRHGGWYVNNVHYLRGACGCVSNNYPDRRWRIVCDDRRGELGQPGDFTFNTRREAALAERELAMAQVQAELLHWHAGDAAGAYHQRVEETVVEIFPDTEQGFGVRVVRGDDILKPARFTGCFEQALGWGMDEVAVLRKKPAETLQATIPAQQAAVGCAGVLTFGQIERLLLDQPQVTFDGKTAARFECYTEAFDVHQANEPTRVFGEAAASDAVFDGERLLMQDMSGRQAVFSFGTLPLVYLTNACGEATGSGTVNVDNEDLVKIPFEEGPGVALAYLVELVGAKYLLANLEVAYQDAFWGEDGGGFEPEEAVRAYCHALRDFVRPRLLGKALLLQLDESMPARFVVSVMVPLDVIHDKVDAFKLLDTLLGTASDLVDVTQFGDRPA